MFELFTEKAIRAVMLSQEEARRQGHNLVGTEQVLLGLIREQTSPAAQMLVELGVTLDAARAECEKLQGAVQGAFRQNCPLRHESSVCFPKPCSKRASWGKITLAPNIYCLP